ncbi:DUF3793 family protein [Clostridium sardiniense]|uniref:DUF3793 family protein n=1 Tax=Clostridium sardiniense TaxID=29369 RepID=A0ABS7L048_CLOSR|nr:DUF3793 family protein [Clostridium sardiniense]MBY0756435.1 DUF3793 family protein [Clostridium sardiniense]MDQ0460175.1 hypothetical protein [Clostridium sardiniense]
MEIKIKQFMSKLKDMNNIEYFDKYMLFLLAPVVGGLKPSSTITLKKDSKEYLVWNNYKETFLNKIGLKHVVLREDDKAIILLIYSEKNLEKFINNKETKEFLLKLEYNLQDNLGSILDKLVQRYNRFHCPHELGVFLGIPLEDVIDFMECTTKKCLLCGYWKVFNNSDDALEIFNNYNRSKELVLDSVIFDVKSEEIILSLQNEFKIVS